MTISSRHPSLFILVFLATLISIIVYGGNDTSALSNIHPGDSDNRLIVNATTGGGVFPSPSSYSYLYVPAAAATAQVRIQDIGNEVNGAPGRISHFTVRAIDSSGNCLAPYLGNSVIAPSNGTVPNNHTITFNAVATQMTPGGTYKIYCVHAQTSVGTLGYAASCFGATAAAHAMCFSNVTFRLFTPTSGALLGNFSGSDNALGTGYYRRLFYTGTWNTEWVGFALPCGVNAGGAIQLFDLDTYQPSDVNMRIQLDSAPRGSSSWVRDNINIAAAGYPAGPGSGPTSYHPLNVPSGGTVTIMPVGNFQPDRVYRIQIVTIGNGNKVRIRIPYLALTSDTNTSCNTAPTGTLSASCEAGTGVISVSANVSDPDGGTLTVTANVSGSGTPASNTVARNGNGTVNLGTFQRTPNGTAYTVSGSVTDSTNQTFNMASVNVTCSRPDANFMCNLTTNSPSGPYGVGETFTVTIVVDGRTSDPNADQMNPSTHPMTITVPPGIAGIPAGPYNYSFPSWPGLSNPINFPNISGSTPGIYTISVSVGGQPCASEEIVVGNKSYMKVFGGETAAGGGFGSGCVATGSGGFSGWSKPEGSGYAGSSAQLTVATLMSVNDGFFSASHRGTAGNTRPPKGLTFANYEANTFGGNFTSARCLPDFFNGTRDTAANQRMNWNGQNFASAPAGRTQFDGLAGSSIANSGSLTVDAGKQVAVYATGDINIRGNVIYGGAPSWDTAPYFVLITTGDIYINSSVTRLDGLYISQGGTIYTCSNGSSSYTPAQVFDSCSSLPLAINGGLLAQNIKWHRLRGSLVNATFGESPSSFADGSCGAGCNISEVINYTADMWRSISPLKVPGSTTIDPSLGFDGKYESIKDLPPIF